MKYIIKFFPYLNLDLLIDIEYNILSVIQGNKKNNSNIWNNKYLKNIFSIKSNNIIFILFYSKIKFRWALSVQNVCSYRNMYLLPIQHFPSNL